MPFVRHRCSPCSIVLVLGIIALAIGYGWVSHVVREVWRGAGLDYCCAIQGVRFNYVAVFVLLCGIAITLAIAAVLQFREWRSRREVKERYGIELSRHTGPSTRSRSAGPDIDGLDHADGD